MYLRDQQIGRRVSGVLGLTLIACGAPGCGQFGPGERESLQRASDSYTRGDVASAVATLDPLIRDFGTSPQAAEAYYLRGLCHAEAGDLTRARSDFQAALDKTKRADLTARAQASLAAIAYREGDWSNAAKLFAESTPFLPEEPPTDEILYTAGLAMQRAGIWQGAREHFGRIRYQFANRPVASEAGRQLLWRHPYHAIQVGAFRNVTNAREAAEKYRDRGVGEVVIESHPRGGEALWVLMTGRHATYNEAIAALTRVKTYVPGAYIIPRP